MVVNSYTYCACKDCTERYVGCHSDCDKYKDFLKRNEKIKQKKKIDAIVASTNSNRWIYSKRRRKDIK